MPKEHEGGVSIVNHTKKPIDIIVQENIHTVPPGSSLLFFSDHVEVLSLVREKECSIPNS